ncbi:MAG: GTP pyrophosphokinase family protein [Bacilli bacterium]|nr:GTP pyrophosphokinase family protein [Bacilli bacterium]
MNDIDEIMEKYQFGKQMLETEIDILIKEFASTHGYNPVEHVKSRIKSKKSINEKLVRKNLAITTVNIVNHLVDIIGIRIVCSFIPDVYDIVSTISQSKNIIIKERKDYIASPKKSGYSSYHLIVFVPIYLKGKVEYVPAEIQIRTVAMDFWASLDHKIQYKFEGNTIPDEVEEELYKYSRAINELDTRMMNLNELMKKYKKEF